MTRLEWDKLPERMRTDEVRAYYDILEKKAFSLRLKRIFDFTAAVMLLALLALPMLVIAVLIKLDSEGPVFYRQERVTQYGRRFRIHKFRTMVADADKIGTAVTVGNDSRITKMGSRLRDLRFDELPQLFDVISGDMSFVGTRPEYYATLLLPAGITSEASIKFKDEAKLLEAAENADETYVNDILPEKMRYNLGSIKKFSLFSDLCTMIKTVTKVIL